MESHVIFDIVLDDARCIGLKQTYKYSACKTNL